MPETFQATLDNCHLEPIHIPGSVQPHGILLAVTAQDLVISHVSENIAQLSGIAAADVIGKPIATLLDQAFCNKLNTLKSPADFFKSNPLLATITGADGQTCRFDAIANQSDELILIDLEPESSGNDHGHRLVYQDIRHFTTLFLQHDAFESILENAVMEIRRITGFDRVMLYKFDPDYNGEVICEAKRESLNAFLGQHFPESDIPPQARALYLRNPIRLLADVDAEPAALLPTRPTVDLSLSSLRSVSPIHRQYLRNMGVKASMSISIVVDGALWGLIACHHYEPYQVPFTVRESALHIGLMLSHVITVQSRAAARMAEAQLLSINAKLGEQLSRENNFTAALNNNGELLLQLVNASGVAWRLDGQQGKIGKTPDDATIDAIYAWSLTRNKSHPAIYHTHELSRENPSFRSISDIASGILVLPISEQENTCIVWFREEVIETKHWGGKPEKFIEFLDDGSHRLMPRSSFELWKENVREKSPRWSEAEIAIALKFKNTILNYVLQQSERLKDVNQKLEQEVSLRTRALQQEITARKQTETELSAALATMESSNKELEHFAFVASHDLQEPLRKIMSFSSRLIEILDGTMPPKAADYFQRMADSAFRMQSLIQDLLELSSIRKREDYCENVDLNTMVREIQSDLSTAIRETDCEIVVDDLGQICGDKAQLSRLFYNLIHNAVKFSQKSENRQIRIQIADTNSEDVTYEIRDHGIGFDLKYEKKIFELFGRLHSRADYKGTGLGLAICQKIVDRHNGVIWAKSKPGKGTSFFIRLPRKQYNPDVIALS